MSGPNSVGRNEALYRPIGNPSKKGNPPNDKTERAARGALAPTQKAKEPRQRNWTTESPKSYQKVLEEKDLLKDPRSPSTHPIKNRPPTTIRQIETRQKNVEKTEPPVLENPPQSFFQFAHLFLAGICTLIGAFIYALYRFFSTQPTEENDHRERFPPFIGKKDETLQYLESQYNRHVMQNLNSLKTEHLITGVRPIRGDGNCYYRATLFGLLEQVIQKNPRERQSRLEHIANVFKAIKPPTQAHNTFIAYLEQAAQDSIWHSVEELEAAFLNEQFNFAMTRSAKDLLADWTRQNAGIEFHGITLETTITTQKEYGTVEDFISKVISPEGKCVEGPAIDVGGLGIALGFNILVYVLPSTEGSKISVIGNLPPQSANEEVHLVLRPGHYDLLYKSDRKNREQEEVKDAIRASSSYTPDRKVYGSKPLDSMKKGLMGFGNRNNEPLVPLSPQVAAQIDRLKKPPYNIQKWRPVAGDGECYYRANMFGLIEQIIKTGKRARFAELAQIFERLTPSLPQEHQTAHNGFVACLKAAGDGTRWQTLDAFKHDVVDLTTGFDTAMVRAARYLVASEVEKRASSPPSKDGTTIENLIGGSLENYCKGIRTLGNYANGLHVNMGLLNQALNFTLTLYTAAGQEGFFKIEQPGGYEKVSILFVPEREHYVLVYP
jgi:ubiquitin thioesterase protein OTUB1